MTERQKFGVVLLGIFLFTAGYLLGRNTPTFEKSSQVAQESKSGQVKKEPEKIAFGFIGPLSGDMASLGQNLKVAVELARDEINENGGVRGKKLGIVFGDGKCDAKEAAKVATKLINTDKVTAIIGGVCSVETLAIALLAEKARVPLISPASTSAEVALAGQYTFRFVPSDSFQGIFAAEHLAITLKKKNIGLLSCMAEYCTGIREAFKKRLGQLGGRIVSEETFEDGIGSLRSQAWKLKNKKAEAVYFISPSLGATLLGLRQFKESGLAPVFGVDAWDGFAADVQVQKFANGAQYPVLENKPLSKEFIEQMAKQPNGKALVVYAPRAYDSVKALALIIEKGMDVGESMQKELLEMKEYQGIADTYSFDRNGDLLVGRYGVRELKDGKAQEVKK